MVPVYCLQTFICDCVKVIILVALISESVLISEYRHMRLYVRYYGISPQECATPDTLSMGLADGENSRRVV